MISSGMILVEFQEPARTLFLPFFVVSLFVTLSSAPFLPPYPPLSLILLLGAILTLLSPFFFLLPSLTSLSGAILINPLIPSRLLSFIFHLVNSSITQWIPFLLRFCISPSLATLFFQKNYFLSLLDLFYLGLAAFLIILSILSLALSLISSLVSIICIQTLIIPLTFSLLPSTPSTSVLTLSFFMKSITFLLSFPLSFWVIILIILLMISLLLYHLSLLEGVLIKMLNSFLPLLPLSLSAPNSTSQLIPSLPLSSFFLLECSSINQFTYCRIPFKLLFLDHYSNNYYILFLSLSKN